MDLAVAVQHYGYPAVFLGSLLEGETDALLERYDAGLIIASRC